MIKEHHWIEDSNGPDIAELGSCWFYMIHRACSMVKKATDWGWNKFPKAVYAIFKNSIAQAEDNL